MKLILLFIAEEGNAMAAIAEKPVDAANFIKHCDQRRKYPVLLRVEFQVQYRQLFHRNLPLPCVIIHE